MNPLPPSLLAVRPELELDGHPVAPTIGRPPRSYTRGLHDQIVLHIHNGNRPVTAAAMAGITSQTFYTWMRLGKAGDVHLAEFAEDVELAIGKAEGTALEAVKAFADPENAKWYLERTRAAGFSKEVNAKVEGALQEFVQRLRDGLMPLPARMMSGADVYAMVVAIAGGQAAVELEGPARFQLVAHDQEDPRTPR